MRYLYLFIGLLLPFLIKAQESPDPNNLSGLSGHIHDQISKKELENATVELLNFVPRKISQTNPQGEFELSQVPFGRHKLLIKKEGYENKIVSDIIISAGNTFHLEIEMQQTKADEPINPQNTNETTANYFKSDKDQPNNPLSSINAEPFTLEEVVRYAGARMDLGRLTNNLAGVTNNYDARNDIVVRGISPAFTTWQIEELPVDNPNHFGFTGSSGGTNSLLNIFALGKADFIKGGFNAQYGNASSGFFDLSLRRGNSKNLQLMGVVGTQRAEFLIEGPLSKKLRNSSILLSARHSTGSYLFGEISRLMRDNPVPALVIRDWADPQHTDINLKIDLGKMGKHNIEAFAVAGYMKFFLPHNFRSVRDELRYIIFENEQLTARTTTVFGGIKHTYRPNTKVLFRNVLGACHQYQNLNYLFNFTNPNTGETEDYFTSYLSHAYKINYTWHSYMQVKGKKTLSKAGFIANVYDIDAIGNYVLFNYFDMLFNGVFHNSQFYAQTRWDISSKLSAFAGVNVLYSSLARQVAPSPSLTLQYEINPQHNLSLSAGLYHQTQHLQSLIMIPYLGFDSLENNIYDFGEREAKMMSSRQLNFEYNWLISKNWRLKLQAYYYLINGARISKTSTYYSGLNTNYSFFDTNYDPTIAQGKGENKGIELSIEKFFYKGWYLLANGTLYDAKVFTSDSIWRNSIFNNRFIANFLIGREFNFGYANQHVFFADARFSTHGGRPYTPIDAEATFQNGLQNLGTEGVLIDSLYNTPFTPNFYQIDIKLGFRFNALKTKTTHTLRLDLFNAFNFKNVYDYRYSSNYDPFGNPVRGEVIPVYQRGFIPDLTYMIQF